MTNTEFIQKLLLIDPLMCRA